MLQLIAQPGGVGSALEVAQDIIIGTIPMRKTGGGTPMLTVKGAARRISTDQHTPVKKKPTASPLARIKKSD